MAIAGRNRRPPEILEDRRWAGKQSVKEETQQGAKVLSVLYIERRVERSENLPGGRNNGCSSLDGRRENSHTRGRDCRQSFCMTANSEDEDRWLCKLLREGRRSLVFPERGRRPEWKETPTTAAAVALRRSWKAKVTAGDGPSRQQVNGD